MNAHNDRFRRLACVCALALAGCSDDQTALDDPDAGGLGGGSESSGHAGDEGPAIICEPGELRCDDERTLGVCAATGLEWESTPCGTHQLCDDCFDGDPGECTATCVGPCEGVGVSLSSAGCSFYTAATHWSDVLFVTNPDTHRTATVELRTIIRGTNVEDADAEQFELDPGESHTFSLPSDETYDESWASLSRHQSGGVWHVVSDLPLVARRQAPANTGTLSAAALLLPEHMMTGDHVIYGYPPRSWNSEAHPNYFTIIALEHQTTVRWWPTAATAGDGVPLPFVEAGGMGQQLLNRYDNIRVASSSKLATPACEHDLSGTVIVADKPVWVESAVFWANVPACPSDGCESETYSGTSCGLGTADLMMEQNLPIQYWGTEYVGPHAPVRGDEDHYWRIFAGADEVVVTVHPAQIGAPIQLARRGDWREITVPAGVNLRFSGDGPFMPVQYVASVSEAHEVGAPAMVQMVPTSQYLDRYVFEVGSPSDYASVEIHYIQIIGATGGADVVLDGAVIGEPDWEAFGEWRIATREVTAGTHVLESLDPFGAVQYGYAARDDTLRSGYACPVGLRAQQLSTP